MKNLLAQINKINPDTVNLHDATKLPEGWNVVGVLDDNLKRIYGAFTESTNRLIQLMDSAKTKTLDHTRNHIYGNSCDCDAFRKEMKKLNERLATANNERDQLKNLFWSSVQLQFSELLGKSEIALVEGFEVDYNPNSGTCEPKHSNVEIVIGPALQALIESGVFPFSGRRRHRGF